MRKILLPTDKTELSDFAFNLASKLASVLNAKIDVLHIVTEPQGAFIDDNGDIVDDENDYSDWHARKEEAKKDLEKWAFNKPAIDKISVQFGHVDKSILKYVDNNDIDILVMGTDGMHSFSSWNKGSHTSHIMNHIKVPILSLKCNREEMQVNDILLVSDFKKTDSKSLSALKTIQEAFGASLHLLKINTPKSFEAEADVMDKMKKCVFSNELTNVKYHIKEDADVEKGINKFLSENQMDILAIGTHQRSGLSKLFKHSVSDDVLHHVYQPIFTFPIMD